MKNWQKALIFLPLGFLILIGTMAIFPWFIDSYHQWYINQDDPQDIVSYGPSIIFLIGAFGGLGIFAYGYYQFNSWILPIIGKNVEILAIKIRNKRKAQG